MRLPWFNRRQTLEEVAAKAADAALERFQLSVMPINNPLASAPPEHKGWPYALDYPWQFFVTTNPRKQNTKQFSADQLRSWAKYFDPLRSVIEHLKTEVASVPFHFQPREAGANLEQMVKQATEWIGDTGPLGGEKTRRVFEMQVLEDMLVLGAYAVWYERSLGGLTLSCHAIDAATVLPRVDTRGWLVPDYPYEQWVQGVQIARFGPGEMRYDGLVPQTDKPYFESLVEMSVKPILAGMNVDSWNTSWLTDGNVRGGDCYTVPEDWTPEQIQQFTAFFNETRASHAERQTSFFLPSGAAKIGEFSRKDQDFGEFEMQCIRRICSVFAVQPASIGYVGEQYKTSQDGSMKSTQRTGVGRLLAIRKEFYDDLLRRLGWGALELVDADDDLDKREQQAKTLTLACGRGYMTLNEARKEAGLPPVDGGDVLQVAEPEAQPQDEPDGES